jgi:hypothetical protein
MLRTQFSGGNRFGTRRPLFAHRLATRFAELTGAGKEGCSIFFNEGHQQSSIATCLYKDFKKLLKHCTMNLILLVFFVLSEVNRNIKNLKFLAIIV